MAHVEWHTPKQFDFDTDTHAKTIQPDSSIWKKTLKLQRISPRFRPNEQQGSMRQTPAWLSHFLLGIQVIRDLVSWQFGFQQTTQSNITTLEDLLLQFNQRVKHEAVALLAALPPDTSLQKCSDKVLTLLLSTDENRDFLLQALDFFSSLSAQTSTPQALTQILSQNSLRNKSHFQKRLSSFQKLTPQTKKRLLKAMNQGGYTFLKKRCVKEIQHSAQTMKAFIESSCEKIKIPIDITKALTLRTTRHILLAFNWSEILNKPELSTTQTSSLVQADVDQAVDTLWRFSAKLIKATGMEDQTSALKNAFSTGLPVILNILTSITSGIKTKSDLQKNINTLLHRSLIPTTLQQSLASQAKKCIHVINPEILKNITRSLTHGNHYQLGMLTELLPHNFWQELASRLECSIATLDPYKTFPFYQVFADKLCSGLGDNPVVQDVARVISKGYYAALEQPEKNRLISSILSKGGPKLKKDGSLSEDGFAELVLRMVQAGGPCFQKSMQLFKDDIPSKSLQDILEKVTNGITPLSKNKARRIIQDNFQAIQFRDHKKYQLLDPTYYTPMSKEWPTSESMENHLQCLGSATIGQTHLVYIQEVNNGLLGIPKPVAIKIQRPQVRDKIQREMAAMKRINGINESLKDTFSALESGILAEADFNREAHFADYLQPLYSSFSSNLCTTSVVKILASSETMLIEEFSLGQPIPTLINELKHTATQEDYSQFLNNAGISLSQLVSGFCKASILGDQTNSYQLIVGNPSDYIQQHGASTPQDNIKNVYFIFKQDHQWFGQTLHSYSAHEPANNINANINTRLGGKLALHQTTTPQSALEALDIKSYSMLCQDLRETLNKPLLFQGEAFIDSDRHAGNMLYERRPAGADHLTVIDTGAGCIITKQERKGMFRMVSGVASSNSELFFDGLTALIPSIADKSTAQKQALAKDITRVITRQNIDNEKINLIYQYLLKHEIVDGNNSASSFFESLDNSENAALKNAILNFDHYEAHKKALVEYLMQTPNANQISHFRFENYEEKIKNANFERFLAVNFSRSLNPATWVTDGENSLLFVRTIRQVATSLNKHHISAPDVVVQVNRGTQCIENQLRCINNAKSELLENITFKQKQEATQGINKDILYKLQPVKLGPAYMKGLLSFQIIQDEIESMSMRDMGAALKAFTWDRINALAHALT